MQTPQRNREPGLIGRLLAEPWRFGLMPAMTLLLRWLGRRGVPRDTALTTLVRFRNSVSLGFPVGEIEALHVEDGADGQRIVLTPSCLGLLGTAGTLPLHDTDRVARADPKEDGTRLFLDGFSGRMLALFWQAWAMHRQELALDTPGGDDWRLRLLALAGTTGAGGDVGAWFAGQLRGRPVSTTALQSILAGTLGLPIHVESLTGCWINITPSQHGTLGTPNPTLGGGAILGKRQWRTDRRVRIVIGPLAPASFDWLLPRADGARALSHLLALSTPQMLCDYEICLLPGPDCIRPLALTARPGAARRLGWDSFLAGGPARREVRYRLKPRFGGDIPCL